MKHFISRCVEVVKLFLTKVGLADPVYMTGSSQRVGRVYYIDNMIVA